MIRPSADLALYRADMAEWGSAESDPSGWRASQRDWVRANDACRLDILDRLDRSGPLPSRELPDRCVVPWRSTGWTNNRNVTQLLEFMVLRGEVAIAGRRGSDRLWDLATRVYPDDPVVDRDDACAWATSGACGPWASPAPGGRNVRSSPPTWARWARPPWLTASWVWRVDPALLGQPFDGRAALLSPFDRLIHDRKRMAELFEFDYQLEMYKPAAQRRWGYFALPILLGDRLIGKLDATADRKAGQLRIAAIHQDVPFDAAVTAAVQDEITDLGHWLELVLG